MVHEICRIYFKYYATLLSEINDTVVIYGYASVRITIFNWPGGSDHPFDMKSISLRHHYLITLRRIEIFHFNIFD